MMTNYTDAYKAKATILRNRRLAETNAIEKQKNEKNRHRRPKKQKAVGDLDFSLM